MRLWLVCPAVLITVVLGFLTETAIEYCSMIYSLFCSFHLCSGLSCCTGLDRLEPNKSSQSHSLISSYVLICWCDQGFGFSIPLPRAGTIWHAWPTACAPLQSVSRLPVILLSCLFQWMSQPWWQACQLVKWVDWETSCWNMLSSVYISALSLALTSQSKLS